MRPPSQILVDNSVLANLLPGVIDSTLELVLASQLAESGVDCGVARRAQYVTDLPGRFRLLADDAAGYEYSGEGAPPSSTAASAEASAHTPTPAHTATTTASAASATTDAGSAPSASSVV
jgi:hypothetical protein